MRAAAELESSKAFAKDFMARYEIPTARYAVAHSAGFATLMLESGDFGNESTPVVVKADGLAAGKGVVVARNRAEAIAACNDMESLVGSAAASKIILEECLTGREVSLLAFVDGEHFALMPPVRDHKRIGDGDTGANTGGMGTVTDESILTSEQRQMIVDTIIRPTLHGCIRDGFPFRGILFLGLMMTDAGPSVLEYNVRFGDPETQSILPLLDGNLAAALAAAATGDLDGVGLRTARRSAVTVVIAAGDYPDHNDSGSEIHGIDEAEQLGALVFHGGTGRRGEQLVTNGGRILGVTGVADDLERARAVAYDGAAAISFAGARHRTDIAQEEAIHVA